ncbi:phosphate ABC transporter permease subunit PstC [Rhodovulum sp. DZ06]|uniref:phosphate ABC transporter permease subunit PstC n=1 Tax=Rhodovulum sp. DZ06 TaxID=3425126 RepID=UPI003D32B3B0
MLLLVVIAVLAAAAAAYVLGRAKAVRVAGPDQSLLHSRPSYHGLYSMLWVALAGFGVMMLTSLAGSKIVDAVLYGTIYDALPDALRIEAQVILRDAKAIATGGIASDSDALRTALAESYGWMNGLRLALVVGLTAAAAGLAYWKTNGLIDRDFRARNRSEKFILAILWGSATIAILTTIGIVLSLVGETLSFFNAIGWQVDDYLFGTTWSPLSGVHDGAFDAGKVGFLPLFVGTLLITLIAMLVAVPIGLFAAIYLSDFASARTRAWAKPMLEILAGIPTVVYGFFAAITVAPFIRGAGESIGLSVASESALAAGLVMGIMIIPFISSLSDDVINAVPQTLRDGSYGLGATRAETMRQVVLPAALPGIVSAVLLGVSRAVGETMIVVMAAGQGANLTVNPLEAVTTVTVQIVMLITGDTEASVAAGPAFTLGFTLFCVTLGLNVIALRIVRKYREMYD